MPRRVLVFSLLFSASASVLADGFSGPQYIHLDTGVAVGKESKETSLFYRAGIGYNLSENFSLGLAASHIGDDLSSGTELILEPYVRGRLDLADAFAGYMDLGARTSGGVLTVGVGTMYQLTPRWQLNVGYRWYQEPNSQLQGDVYTLALGVEYRFGVTQTNTRSQWLTPVTSVADAKVMPIVVPEPAQPGIRPLITAKHIAPPSPTTGLKAQSQNMNPTRHSTHQYLVKPGDWLLKISQQQNITLSELLNLNPWLAERAERNWVIYPGESLTLAN